MNDFSVFTGFSCGHADLDDYIANDAEPHARHLAAVTYGLSMSFEDGTVSAPLAFASLLNDTVQMSNGFKRKLPRCLRYRTYPAVKIGRLGVRAELKGRHIGSQLLDILKIMFTTNNRTGCRLMTVDAYNDVASFYLRNEFQFLTDKDKDDPTRAMFFDLARFTQDSAESG